MPPRVGSPFRSPEPMAPVHVLCAPVYAPSFPLKLRANFARSALNWKLPETSGELRLRLRIGSAFSAPAMPPPAPPPPSPRPTILRPVALLSSTASPPPPSAERKSPSFRAPLQLPLLQKSCPRRKHPQPKRSEWLLLQSNSFRHCKERFNSLPIRPCRLRSRTT